MKAVCFIPGVAQAARTSMKVAFNCINANSAFCENEAEARNALEKSDPQELCILVLGTNSYRFASSILIQAQNVYVAYVLSDRLNRLPTDLREKISGHAFIGYNGSDIDMPEFLGLLNKLMNKDIFGLGYYISDRMVRQTYSIQDRMSKDNAIDVLQESILKFGRGMMKDKFRYHAQRISIIADELILNAIFHANPRLRNLSRSERFRLDAKEQIQVEWRFDGRYFGLSVRDQFGNLEIGTVTKYLTGIFPKEPLEKRHSGGMGLRFVFEQSDQMVINLKRDTLAEVICLMKLQFPLRPMMREAKSFHFFETP